MSDFLNLVVFVLFNIFNEPAGSVCYIFSSLSMHCVREERMTRTHQEMR